MSRVKRKSEMANRRYRNRSGNGQKSSGKSTKSNNAKKCSNITSKKIEFKFQLQDGSRKGGYTYEKILQAIILKYRPCFRVVNYLLSIH